MDFVQIYGTHYYYYDISIFNVSRDRDVEDWGRSLYGHRVTAVATVTIVTVTVTRTVSTHCP